MAQNINLAGKDFFTEDEVAFYTCVSKSNFRKKRKEYGIMPGDFMGKKVA